MSILWFLAGMVVCLFVPSPLSSWGRAKIIAIWNKIFNRNTTIKN
jgi:hypothetical protein